jgi:hypothetical protein
MASWCARRSLPRCSPKKALAKARPAGLLVAMRNGTEASLASVLLMMIALLAGVAVAVLPLIGLATSAPAGIVRGTVVLGPMCPGPPRPGQECADKPIATTIDVFRSLNGPTTSDKPYRRIKSDEQGEFQISLDPGSYWFLPHVPQERAGISFPKPVKVMVTAGTTRITLLVDTGMR